MRSNESSRREEPSQSGVSDLNEQASKDLLERSLETSRDVVDFIYRGMHIFVAKDRELDRRLDKEPLGIGDTAEFFITEDILAAPKKYGVFQRCFSMKLLARNVGGSVAQGSNEMMVYLPIPDGVSVLEGEIPRPDNIYVEHTNMHGDRTRYSVGEEGFFAYIAERDDGTEVTEIDILEELSADIGTGLPALAALYQNLVNMKVVPQRRVVGGDPTAYKL